MSFLHTIKCIVLPVFDLNPMLRPTGLIGPVAMLGDETLQPELAGLAGQVRPDLALLKGIDEDPLRSAGEQSISQTEMPAPIGRGIQSLRR